MVGGFFAQQALVAPVPDEAALEEAFGADAFPVFGEAAGGVAHGVVELALDERLLLGEGLFFLAPQPAVEAADPEIHRRVKVGVGATVVALVVDGARRIEPAAELGHGGEVGAVAGLVAEGPEDDARVVAEQRDHVAHAVEVGLAPGGGVGELVLVVGAVGVGLDVGLGDDVEAVFVHQVEEARVVRVVGGANGVDVEPLHGVELGAHGGLGDVLAGEVVVVVAVDALDEHGAAVHEELAVLDLGAAEADARGVVGDLGAGGVAQGEEERVEAGIFGGPRLDAQAVGGGGDLVVGAGGGRGAGELEGGERARGVLVGRVEEAGLDGVGTGGAGEVAGAGGDAQAAGAVVVGEAGVEGEVADVERGGGPEVNVAEDAREAPEILVLEVGAVAVTPDGDGEGVFAVLEVGREVELGGGAAVLRVADLAAVHPEAEGGGDAVEDHEGLAVAPAGGDLEVAAVGGDGVALGEGGPVARGLAHDARGVLVERIRDVGVDGGAVAVHLDVRRHGDGFPGGDVEGGILETRRQAVRRRGPVDTPVAVERDAPRRGVAVADERGGGGGVGELGGAGGLLVDAKDGGVFPVGRSGPGREGEGGADGPEGGEGGAEREQEGAGNESDGGAGGHGRAGTHRGMWGARWVGRGAGAAGDTNDPSCCGRRE